MTPDEIIPQLNKVRKSGNGWTACCPAHDDKNPSLGIVVSSNGNAVPTCFTGCSYEEIMASLGSPAKTNGHAFATKNAATNGASGWNVVRTHVYYDEFYQPKYEKVLLKPTANEKKPFRWLQYTPNGKKGGLKGTTAIPYRLPELMKATEIIAAEGEKDADSLQKLGLTATSLKDWRPEFNEYVKDCNVTVIRDHDKPGVKYADRALHILYGNVKSLKLIDLYDQDAMPEDNGKDVSDWIEERRDVQFKDPETIAEELCSIFDRAEEWTPADAAVELEEEPIIAKAHPEPLPECFHGLAGDFVDLILPHSEADRMALLLQFLTHFGSIVGRSPFMRVEFDRHHTNLYCVLVGPTGCRKGTAASRVRQAFKGIDPFHEAECLASGLSSGEGLLYKVRDEVWAEKKGKTGIIEKERTDFGASDKRLLITEGEFAQVLGVQSREGNTLKSYLRNLWDSGTAGSMTKNSPLKTTNAHVSLVGHITGEELLATLDATSAVDGSVNRILWVSVRRTKLLPFGGDIPYQDLERLQGRIAAAVNAARLVDEMTFTEGAKSLWINSYEKLETSRFGFLAKVTQRASPQTLRLACIFALLDQQSQISRQHLQAALAVWQYCEDSARYIFGERLSDKHADKLLTALRAANNGMTRSDIRDLFHGNMAANDLRRVLQLLSDNNLAYFQKVRKEGSKKPSEVWFAIGNK